MNVGKYLDPGSQLVMLLTLGLFVAALFLKGLSHDLLLEAGVFLVSVKLIIMSYKNAVASKRLEEQLGAMLSLLQDRKGQPAPDRPTGPA
jgi:hypothetical protein